MAISEMNSISQLFLPCKCAWQLELHKISFIISVIFWLDRWCSNYICVIKKFIAS